MESQHFNYKETFSYWRFLPALVFFGLTSYSLITKTGIRFKRFKALIYPNSVYVFGGLAAVFSIYALLKFSRFRKNSAISTSISLTDSTLEFASKGVRIKLSLAEIESISENEDEDDGESFKVHTSNGNNYEFFSDHFDSPDKYNVLKSKLA